MQDVFVKLNVTLTNEHNSEPCLCEKNRFKYSRLHNILALTILNNLALAFHNITDSSDTRHAYNSFCNDAHT